MGACKLRQRAYIRGMNTDKEFGHMTNTMDTGRVKLGGMSPSLAPTHDLGKVRLGGMSPSLPMIKG